MADASPLPEPFDPTAPETIARVDAEARRIAAMVNPAVCAIDARLQAAVILAVGIASVMNVVRNSGDPGEALLGAIRILVQHGQGLGWLATPPAGAATALIFPSDQPAAESDPFAGAEMGRPN